MTAFVPGRSGALSEVLAALSLRQEPGTYTFVSHPTPPPSLLAKARATIREPEGVTVVVSVDDAIALGCVAEFEAAWLTLEVPTSLDLVGLTAAVASALAAEGIACNVLAGRFHDHLLVPVERVDDARVVLDGLRRRAADGST